MLISPNRRGSDPRAEDSLCLQIKIVRTLVTNVPDVPDGSTGLSTERDAHTCNSQFETLHIFEAKFFSFGDIAQNNMKFDSL